MKNKLQGHEFTWAKFLEELRGKFYPITVQQQMEKEFMELKMSGNMTVTQYARKFMELSRFAPDFVASEKLKMRRFEEGLAFYIRNQLAGQPIQTYQELYERAAKVERVKGELRALNPGNPKRKWDDHSVSSDSVAQKRTAGGPAKSRPEASTEPCTYCGRTNHTTAECRVGTNKFMWCGSPNHSIVTCPRRLRVVEKGVVRPIQPPCQEALPLNPQRQDELT